MLIGSIVDGDSGCRGEYYLALLLESCGAVILDAEENII
jgi:hypothetical protein